MFVTTTTTTNKLVWGFGTGYKTKISFGQLCWELQLFKRHYQTLDQQA